MIIKAFQSAKNTGDRFHEIDIRSLSKGRKTDKATIDIKLEEEFQCIEGFGGAFTEAGAVSLKKISEEKRKEAIGAYFSPNRGIGYNLCRTHINSCDFSTGNYAYDETDGDTELKDFTISRDREALLPLIKDALSISKEDIKIFASPWSPPAWLKTTGKMNNGGELKEEYREVWAKYFARYIKEYAKEGVNIWAVTIQNEPQAITPWDNCIYSHEQERDFVKILGPVLEKETDGVKIIVWDHNKDLIEERAKTILLDEEAAKYVWGVGFHWYSDSDDESVDNDESLDKVHEAFPDKKLIFTEGCNPLYGYDKPFFGEWWTGEKYAHHIINDLNHNTVAWCDWNMFLDERGGPNHVNNFCDAPIIVDTKKDMVYYNSPYYFIGHFSKYIKRGAIRLGSYSNSSLECVACKNPNGDIVVVVLNKTDEEIPFNMNIGGERLYLSSDSHSIITFLIEID